MAPISSEAEWLSALADVTRWQPPPLPTVVVSPHPDDETLGAGGLIAYQTRHRVPVTVIAVTDGEAAYPDSDGLAQIRGREQQAALAELGVHAGCIIRLRLPDGRVTAHEQSLAQALERIVGPETLLIAPWLYDPHSDHEACGRVARQSSKASGAVLFSYVFWTWHKKDVKSLTDQPLVRFELDSQIQTARATALSCHRSQLEWSTGNPVLPQSLLVPAQRPFEIFIQENPA